MFSASATTAISILLSFSSSVLACEGDCIVGITQAFVGNYTKPVHQVLNSLSVAINEQFLSGKQSGLVNDIVAPLYDSWVVQAYNTTEHAIFPSFFHGKCQINGVNPPGCPNYDCPVVCGTPGSLIHYYDTLARIAFNSTRLGLARSAFQTSGPAYIDLEQRVYNAMQRQSRRAFMKGKRSEAFSRHHRYPLAPDHTISRRASPNEEFSSSLKRLIRQFASGAELSRVCDYTNGRNVKESNCYFSISMIPYIKTFP